MDVMIVMIVVCVPHHLHYQSMNSSSSCSIHPSISISMSMSITPSYDIVSLSYAEIIPIEPDTVSTVGGKSSLVVVAVLYVCMYVSTGQTHR